MTTTVSVIYHSGTGHTERLANAVTEGCRRVDGVTVHQLKLSAEQLGPDGRWSDESISQTLAASDAIIFGSPTYMGSVSSIMKAFMEAQVPTWNVQAWKDKFAGGFTNSATIAGDKLNTLVDLVVFAAQLHMIWVPAGDQPGSSGGVEGVVLNRQGTYLGVAAQSDFGASLDHAPPPSDLESGRRHGERITRITQHFKGEGTYTTARTTFFDS